MKKTLALVLALAMVFSTITVAFAEDTLGEDAQVCADLGMLQGEGGTVDAAYAATAPTRLQAAVMFLRLKGLEAEALAFTGEDNFADGEIAWAEGANLIAYLKANPQLGWIGDGTSFNPTGVMTAQAYYKVMLEALGYKQTTAEVAGDFTWEEVLTFAASVGLSKVADVENFTVNDLAVATVEALKVNVKDTEKTLAATLVEAGVVDEAKAVAAGLVEDVAAPITVAIDEVEAIGNTIVQVIFEEDVDAASAGSVDNYAIEGLEIKAAVVNGTDTVLLETAAQTVGKLYKLTSGEQTVAFTGVAKVSGGPEISDVVGEDVEEVVITFDKNIDYATGTDVANYTINGVTVVAAEVDEDEVTLTTEGLKNKTNYVVKVTNIKSVDGVARKTTSEDFKTNFDTVAPKIDGNVKVETNQRIIVTFSEEVDQATAEDIANYSIKVDEKDGAEIEILSVEWDDDDEDNVEIVTEAMEYREDYKLSVNNIADQRKVPNVMTRPSTKTFEGVDEDEDAPDVTGVKVLSPTTFKLTITDDSRIDEASVLDISNYSLECDDEDLAIEDIITLTNETGEFVALFTVEEMTEEDCKLTYVDIMDEFGNATKEDDVNFDAEIDAFASAKLEHALVVGENTIFLIFDKALDEASAETLGYYSVDGDIGTPTKAEYIDDLIVDGPAAGTDPWYVVKLTVNDLVNGKTYDIGVDGVKDLAGNSLKIVDLDAKTFRYNNLDPTKGFVGTWNDILALYTTDDPEDGDDLGDYLTEEDYEPNWDDELELEDAEAVSLYVAALAFDEEVKFAAGATVRLISSDNTYTEGAPLVLNAMALEEDDTVVEFSDFAGGFFFDKSVTYTVYGITGVTDLADNAVSGKIDYSFKGSEGKPDYAEYDKYEQVDAETFKVTMSRDVLFDTGIRTGTLNVTAVETLDDTDTNVTFVATIDADDNNIIYLRGTIEEDADYAFKLFEDFTDEHGIPVVDDDDVVINTTTLLATAGVTEFEGEDEDEKAPVIDDVFARSRTKVRIVFNENIKNGKVVAAKFELWNVDLNEEVDIDSLGDETDNDNIVDLILDTDDALQGRYEYELRIEAGAVEDFAGNAIKADTFVFDGTDLAQH